MKKSTTKVLILALALALTGVGFWSFKENFHLNPLEETLTLEWPSFVASGPGSTTFTLDKSLKRVVASDKYGELTYVLSGGISRPGSFFFADEIAVDQKGRLLLMNRTMDPSGFFTVSMEIQEYSPQGKFLGSLVNKKWPEDKRSPTLVQKGPWFGLGVSQDLVYWFEADSAGLNLWTSKNLGPAEVKPVVSLAQADLLVASADLAPDGSIFYITKKGQIWQKTGTSEILWYDANNVDFKSIPWRVRVQSNNSLIFTDLGRSNIFKMIGPSQSPEKLLTLEPGDNLFISLSQSIDGVLGTVSDAGAFTLGPQGLAKVPDPQLTLGQKFLEWGLWGLVVLGVVLVFAIFWVFYREILKGRIPAFAKRILSVIFLTVSIGGLVSYMVLDNFSKRYSAEVLNKISQLVNLVPRLIDTKALMSLDDPESFLSPDYLKIRTDVIQSIYGVNFERNQGLYFAIHRVNPDGRLYTFMWLNGDPTLWHPYTYLWDPDLAYQASLQGQSQAYSALDAFGSWLLATAPIKDETGKVIGVFEMGGDFYSFTQENNRLIQSLVVNIATVLILLLILMVEGSFLGDLNQRRLAQATLIQQGVEPRRDRDSFHGVFLARPLAVILFTALSMSLLFLPLVMSDMVKTLGKESSWILSQGLPESVLLSLPLSVRLLFFGVGTLLAGSLTHILGWRMTFGLGLVTALGGTVLSALTGSPDFFLIASGLIGLGTGLTTIGLRSVINSESDSQVRNKAYAFFYAGLIAGTNLGVMAGQWLADYLGYQGVFWVSSTLILVAGWAVWTLGSGLAVKKPSVPQEEGQKSLSLWKLLGDRAVLIFFLAVVLPIYVASMFLGYFLPVFSSAQGLSNGDMGRIFLLNGLIIIYLGPPVAAALRKRMGPRIGVALSTLVWVVSLIPFLWLVNLTGLIWTVALMGLAEGLAVPFQNEYYLALPGSRRVGEDRATGLFEVVGKLGETLAPILIGFSLVLGPIWGFSLVALCLLVGLSIFILSSLRSKKV